MGKKLSEMTQEELWTLFPVRLTDHNPLWKELFLKEKELIFKAAGKDNVLRINHIGSTSIPSIVSKPTIDILMEIKEDADLKELVINLENAGYIYSKQPSSPEPHMMFMKGYTQDGFRGQAYHLHIRYFGDWDEIYFRDYLIKNPLAAARYERLKIRLQKKFKYNRDAYTAAKTAFVKKIVALARKNGKALYL